MTGKTVVTARPITFGRPMAEALRDRKKTQTRRVFNTPWLSTVDVSSIGFTWATPPGHISVRGRFPSTEFGDKHVKCPYGAKGDQLWVREEHFAFGHWEEVTGPKARTRLGRQRWRFVPDSDEVRYLDNRPEEFRKGRHHQDPHTPAWHKRLARFMPRKYSRLTLEITDFRVERLHAISLDDVYAEGWDPLERGFPNTIKFREGQDHHGRTWYRELWESLHGAGSWARNDWVWVVSFRIVATEGK